ncbi:MAG: hypothetical protein EON59_08445 [Alphaproteobacteria bacterium]|nr:MAG: hypothetical protein EON59_08445 [Alphaproteobacteria bacterium]
METKLFQPDITTKRNGKVIGLSISRTIVEAHGGRIWATPRDGAGAVFGLAKHLGDEQADAERNAIQDRIANLRGREREVMDGVVRGDANKTTAFDLGISARTIKVYRANVMWKMQAKTLSELARMVTVARRTPG